MFGTIRIHTEEGKKHYRPRHPLVAVKNNNNVLHRSQIIDFNLILILLSLFRIVDYLSWLYKRKESYYIPCTQTYGNKHELKELSC